MSGALGLVAAWFGFALLALAVKGVAGTQQYQADNSLSVYGSVVAAMALGNWPYAPVLTPVGPAYGTDTGGAGKQASTRSSGPGTVQT